MTSYCVILLLSFIFFGIHNTSKSDCGILKVLSTDNVTPPAERCAPIIPKSSDYVSDQSFHCSSISNFYHFYNLHDENSDSVARSVLSVIQKLLWLFSSWNPQYFISVNLSLRSLRIDRSSANISQNIEEIKADLTQFLQLQSKKTMNNFIIEKKMIILQPGQEAVKEYFFDFPIGSANGCRSLKFKVRFHKIFEQMPLNFSWKFLPKSIHLFIKFLWKIAETLPIISSGIPLIQRSRIFATESELIFNLVKLVILPASEELRLLQNEIIQEGIGKADPFATCKNEFHTPLMLDIESIISKEQFDLKMSFISHEQLRVPLLGKTSFLHHPIPEDYLEREKNVFDFLSLKIEQSSKSSCSRILNFTCSDQFVSFYSNFIDQTAFSIQLEILFDNFTSDLDLAFYKDHLAKINNFSGRSPNFSISLVFNNPTDFLLQTVEFLISSYPTLQSKTISVTIADAYFQTASFISKLHAVLSSLFSLKTLIIKRPILLSAFFDNIDAILPQITNFILNEELIYSYRNFYQIFPNLSVVSFSSYGYFTEVLEYLDAIRIPLKQLSLPLNPLNLTLKIVSFLAAKVESLYLYLTFSAPIYEYPQFQPTVPSDEHGNRICSLSLLQIDLADHPSHSSAESTDAYSENYASFINSFKNILLILNLMECYPLIIYDKSDLQKLDKISIQLKKKFIFLQK